MRGEPGNQTAQKTQDAPSESHECTNAVVIQFRRPEQSATQPPLLVRVHVNEPKFETVCEQFVRRFIRATVLPLVNTDLLKLELENLTNEQFDLIYELCFNGLIQLEGFEPLDHGSDRLAMQPAFTDLNAPLSDVLLSDNPCCMREILTDELVEEVILELAKEL